MLPLGAFDHILLDAPNSYRQEDPKDSKLSNKTVTMHQNFHYTSLAKVADTHRHNISCKRGCKM